MSSNRIIKISFLLLILIGSVYAHAESLPMMSYNVENLFDTINDPATNDDDFTPEGLNHWSPARYYTKLQHIAEVICNAGGDNPPAVVGLLEVETMSCLNDLCRKLHNYPYRPVHFEGPDQRGIDVGLLYDTLRLRLLSAAPLPVPLPEGERPTRDILYCAFLTQGGTPLHVMLCHFPSQLGGAQQTAHKREAARSILQTAADSILRADSMALIVAMGDFNETPRSLPPLQFVDYSRSENALPGTHKYQGHWTILDQFHLSPEAAKKMSQADIFAPDWLLEEDTKYGESRPCRTYIGPRYHRGYSDHLPIRLTLSVH